MSPVGTFRTAIGAGQNLPNRNAVSAEAYSDALGLLYTAGRKVYFLRTVPGRESPCPFSDVDVRVTQQDNLAALLQCSPNLLFVSKCASGPKRQQNHQAEEKGARPWSGWQAWVARGL
jgi:hypothetical protein